MPAATPPQRLLRRLLDEAQEAYRDHRATTLIVRIDPERGHWTVEPLVRPAAIEQRGDS